MRHATSAGIGIAVALTVASWVIFPGAVGAPPPASPDQPPTVAVETAAPAVPAPPPAPTPAAPVTTGSWRAEVAVPHGSAFLEALNDVRADAGAAPLRADAELAGLAASWAAHLAATGDLAHSELIYDVVAEERWRAAGENVGYGPEVAVLVDAFVASPAHHANVVDPDYAVVGVGVVEVDDVLWTVHLFAG